MIRSDTLKPLLISNFMRLAKLTDSMNTLLKEIVISLELNYLTGGKSRYLKQLCFLLISEVQRTRASAIKGRVHVQNQNLGFVKSKKYMKRATKGQKNL